MPVGGGFYPRSTAVRLGCSPHRTMTTRLFLNTAAWLCAGLSFVTGVDDGRPSARVSPFPSVPVAATTVPRFLP